VRGDCRQVFCNNSKINYHFFLYKLAIPYATREIRDSMPRKQSENIFTDRHFPAVNRHGKQRERKGHGTYKYAKQRRKAKRKGLGKDRKEGRKGKDGRMEGTNASETYCLTPLNIHNKRLVPFASLAGIVYQSLAKKSILTRSKMCQAKVSRQVIFVL